MLWVSSSTCHSGPVFHHGGLLTMSHASPVWDGPSPLFCLSMHPSSRSWGDMCAFRVSAGRSVVAWVRSWELLSVYLLCHARVRGWEH